MAIIDRTGADVLIPEENSREIFEHVPEQSVAMQLMRRLPDGRSLLRRQVWTAPICWALTILMSGAVLLGLCWLLWRFKTPAECLPTPENIARLEALDRTRLYFYYQ